MGCHKLTYHENFPELKVEQGKDFACEKTGVRVLYFGARYYNSDLSVWLSVDPLSFEYPSTSPYMYVLGSPIGLIDPNGMNAWIPPTEEGGAWTAEAGDGAETLAKDAGLSREKAYSIMEEQGHGTYKDPNDGITKSKINPGDKINVPTMSSDPIEVMPGKSSGPVDLGKSNAPFTESVNKMKQVYSAPSYTTTDDMFLRGTHTPRGSFDATNKVSTNYSNYGGVNVSIHIAYNLTSGVDDYYINKLGIRSETHRGKVLSHIVYFKSQKVANPLGTGATTHMLVILRFPATNEGSKLAKRTHNYIKGNSLEL